MHERARMLVRTLSVGFLFLCLCGVSGAASAPEDAADLMAAFQRLLDRVDSPGYATRTSWDEHVVLSWQLARGRTPTVTEYHHLKSVIDEFGLPRSAVLSVAVAGPEPVPTWDQVRDLLRRVGAKDFRVTPAIAGDARRLVASPAGPALAAMAYDDAPSYARESPGLAVSEMGTFDYNHYYGYFHAHTSLSDGVGTPDQAFDQARAGGLDYLGVTDHSEFLATNPGNGWQVLKDAADLKDDPGSFVALAGFEWSHPTFGHLLIMNTPDLTHALATQNLKALAQWLLARPDALAQFNHPGRFDLLNKEFLHLPLVDLRFVVQLVGIEVWNRSSDFDDYYYACDWNNCVNGYYNDALTRRWFLGALGGQDNHDASWGIGNPFRTVMLASELNRAALLDAYKERRFYSTEDSDLMLEFTVDGFPIGSRVRGESGLFNVMACDGSSDEFEAVRFYRDGVLLENRAVSGNCIDTTFDDSATTGFHSYYVVVRQTDDGNSDGRNDEAISSPIWTLP